MPELDTTFIEQLLQQSLVFLPRLIAAIVLFLAGLYASEQIARLLHRALRRRDLDEEIALLLKRTIRWGLVIVFTITALEWVDFDLTGFIAGLGVAGIIIGFALQDITRNTTAGILLLLQQPFDLGDYVKIGEFAGTITNIDIRTTELRDINGLKILIPNADVYVSPLTNFTKANPRRLVLPIGVAYQSDLDRVRDVALKAVAAVPGVLEDPAPQLVYQGFGDSAINLELYYYYDTTQSNYLDMVTQPIEAIKRAFDAADIDIPFPIRTVYFPHQMPTTQ